MMSPPCLEPQGCQFDPIFVYLLFCSALSCCSFCLILFFFWPILLTSFPLNLHFPKGKAHLCGSCFVLDVTCYLVKQDRYIFWVERISGLQWGQSMHAVVVFFLYYTRCDCQCLLNKSMFLPPMLAHVCTYSYTEVICFCLCVVSRRRKRK